MFADFPAGTPGRAQSDLAFGGAGLHREVAFEAMATELILGLIEQNLAIAPLPPAFVRPRTSLVSIPVTDGPTRVEYLAWSDFNPSPPARVFLDSLHSSGPGGAPVS